MAFGGLALRHWTWQGLSWRRSPRRWGLSLALLVYGAAAIASANQGKPSPVRRIGVDAGAEAIGIPTVTLVREQLVFDFRPLQAGGRPMVRASYVLSNEGETVVVPLVFASFDVGAGTVTFDGKAMDSRRLDAGSIPETWSTADGPVPSEVVGRGASGIAYELEIPPGQHVSEVSYQIDGDFEPWNSTGHVVKYSFQPAVSWKAVRGLEVTIHCVGGWRCEPGQFSLGGEERRSAASRSDVASSRLEFKPVDGQVQVASMRAMPSEPLQILVRRPPPWWTGRAPDLLPKMALALGLLALLGFARVVLIPSNIGARIATWAGLSVVAMAGAFAFGVAIGRAHERVATEIGGYGTLGTVLTSLVVGVAIVVSLPIVAWIMAMILRATRRPSSSRARTDAA